MTTIEITRSGRMKPIAKKTYWKTYLTFGGIFGVCALLNVIASVQSMYSSTNSQEFEFKKNQLTQQIRDLEQQKSQVTNLHSLQTQALSLGYTPVTHLKYLNTPLTQVVAQR